MVLKRASGLVAPILMLFLSCMACSVQAIELQTPTLQAPQLTLMPETYSGVCPVDIEAEGLLLASESIKVQYRWVYQGAMGEIAIVHLRKNIPLPVTTIFEGVGKTYQADTQILSSKSAFKRGGRSSGVSSSEPAKEHSATVQLLTLPVNEHDWRAARKSREARFKVECATQAVSDLIIAPPVKADLLPGPGISIAGATVPWGGSLVIDARSLQAGRRGTQCRLPIAYGVLNRGRVPAAASQVQLMTGSQVLSLKSIDALAPESEVSVTDTIYLREGRYVLELQVDTLEQVNESSESNNAQRVTVQVLGCAGQ